MIETELGVLRDVSGRLENAGIAFMLTGSMAMSYYAQPRMTRDLILSKLYWAKETRSELQLRDVRNLLAANPDMMYLESCAQTLNVSQLLEEALARNE